MSTPRSTIGTPMLAQRISLRPAIQEPRSRDRRELLDQMADIGRQLTVLAEDHREPMDVRDWDLVDHVQEKIAGLMDLKEEPEVPKA
jgi:hypothetical protein